MKGVPSRKRIDELNDKFFRYQLLICLSIKYGIIHHGIFTLEGVKMTVDRTGVCITWFFVAAVNSLSNRNREWSRLF